MRVQPHGFGHNFAAGAQPPFQKGMHGRTHAARSSSAGQVGHFHAKVAARNGRKILQISVELLHHFRRCPLLRAKNGRCAARAAQGVVHIAGHINGAVGKAGVKGRHVDVRKPAKAHARGFDLLPVCVQQAHAKGLKHARAALVGGAAANAQNKFTRSGIQGRAYELPRAKACGVEGVAHGGRHKGKAAGGGHFDNGCAAIARQAVKCLHRVAQRAAYRGDYAAATGGFDHGIHRAFAAVSHGNLDIDRVGENLAETGFNGNGHLQGRQAFLVRVGRDNNFHATSRAAGICGAGNTVPPQHRAHLPG